MAKKPERSGSKKECPSCGLGVTQDSSICEFCGWDFEEEDEWILQIEKLERDLLLEKQRFEPGTVNHMIESTLRSPVLERAAMTVPESEDAIDTLQEEVRAIEEEEPESEPPPEESLPPERVETAPKVRRVRSVKAPPPAVEEPEAPRAEEPPAKAEEPMPVRVRKAKAPPPEKPEEQPRTRKVRTVRKVKG